MSRGARLAVVGCVVLAVVEFVVSIAVAHGELRWATVFRFAILDVGLIAVLCFVLAPFLALMALVVGEVARAWPAMAFWRRFTLGRADGDPRGWVASAWAIACCSLGYVAASYAIIYTFLMRRTDKPFFLELALLQLAVVVGFGMLTWRLSRLFSGLARVLHRRLPASLRRLNPVGQPWPAIILLCAGACVVAWLLLQFLPSLRPLVPWRQFVSMFAIFGGGYLGLRWWERRSFWLSGRSRRLAALCVGLGLCVLVPAALWKVGADPEAKYIAISASPTLSSVVALVRAGNDFDGDGYGTLLGEKDCAPFDRHMHPNARDVPDNGVDENCSGRDFSLRQPPSYRAGVKLPVPKPYQRDWNFLLITIDTLRYDHTGFGGYLQRKNRDTTPNLDKLAARSLNFSFCNAPSAGTMASVPAILTSRFFHSGVALRDPDKRGYPPVLTDGNTLISEVLRDAGLKTGAILTHPWFSEWGMRQGFDYFDNSLGAKHDAYAITSPEVTDKALAWIARQGDNRWFLWTHYIDPHGRYVSHVGTRSFGETEEDLYDGELVFTDKHLGRLLDGLWHSPAADRTIIIVTSDHGDGFNEHGFINHGMTLFRELLHVPLLVYIPNGEPHTVSGPVSPLDIFPTLTDLVDADISHLTIEGESLVPQLFYSRAATDRIVFAETNWPVPLRAAVSNNFKLIYNLQANLYQLYDLRKDPWEKRNIWREAPAEGRDLKDVLDEWLDRVYYSRDAVTNQAQQQRRDILLSTAPAPQHEVEATVLDAIRVLGWDVRPPTAGAAVKTELVIYFEALKATDQALNLELTVRPQASGSVIRRVARPGKGTFPTTRWRKGDFVRQSYEIVLAPGWGGEGTRVEFRFLDETNKPVKVVGPSAGPDGLHAALGELP